VSGCAERGGERKAPPNVKPRFDCRHADPPKIAFVTPTITSDAALSRAQPTPAMIQPPVRPGRAPRPEITRLVCEGT